MRGLSATAELLVGSFVSLFIIGFSFVLLYAVDKFELSNVQYFVSYCITARVSNVLTVNTDLCPCGETQTMSHIVESCPLTKLNGGLSRLHPADEDAVSWLTNYGK